MDDDTIFIKLFQTIVNQYELSPEAANDLLQKILDILKSSQNDDTNS